MEKITSQHNGLQNLYFSPNIVRTVHTERIKYGGGFMACREKQEIAIHIALQSPNKETTKEIQT
jgi:hypothetical protein